MTNTLTVYKASAGSGKTFTLSIEYIKLLIANPKAYENILAVTFTNKATEEMKMRILTQLYGLWKQLPDSDNYMKKITEDTKVDRDLVSEQAGKALHALLHNYHFFRVQTIDTFFQGVLRNLARELQLNPNLSVGLNNKQVISMAVDQLIDQVTTDKELKNMLMGYISDNIADGKRWDMTAQLKDFGGNIFDEKYKEHHKDLQAAFANPAFFRTYKGVAIDRKREIEDKYRSMGKGAMDIIGNSGLTVDNFKYGTGGPLGYFIKLANGRFNDPTLVGKRVEDAKDNPEAWSKKDTMKAQVEQMAEQNLIPMIEDCETTRKDDIRLYNTLKLTLSHINDMSLLHRIEENIGEINEQAQRFMLSDTQSLLHDMIEDNDSPFIFEKIGTRLEHIMIDEFQDTSRVQWDNFKVLLNECMSQGGSNLIVGDVKQSIYRFRNGDWRLLNNIEKEFTPTPISTVQLAVNYRSTKRVIQFNNVLIRNMADLCAKAMMSVSERHAFDLAKAYGDVKQEVPEDKPDDGYARITLLPSEDYQDATRKSVLNTIKELLEAGAHQNEIAILVRKNKDIPTLAAYIENETGGKVKVVSAEAFRLDASSAVRLIVNTMKWISQPNDLLAEAAMVTDYLTAVHKDKEMLDAYLTKKVTAADAMPKELSSMRSSLLSMTLHDMAETIVRVLNIDKCQEQSAFVTTFFDALTTFCTDMAPMLNDFLATWDEELCSKTIETSGSGGIRIMSIHKSKGLEFEHVIFPYCDWNTHPTYSTRTTLWLKPTTQGLDAMPIVPLDFYGNNSLADSDYEQAGKEEHTQDVVDSLNMLYVAVTRACQSLFVIGKRPKGGKSAPDNEIVSYANQSDLLNAAIEVMCPDIDGEKIYKDCPEDESMPVVVSYGELTASHGTKKQSSNVFASTITPHPINVASHKTDTSFKQSNESRRFASDELNEKDRMRMVRMGTIMHQVFAGIHTIEDVEPTLRRMEFDGTLYAEDMTRNMLIKEINAKFENEQVKAWFAPGWTVMNERDILTPNGQLYRPDRVVTNGNETIVIDFKFGSKQNSYIAQVQEYMDLIKSMGSSNVSGYIWYVGLDEIVPVV